MFLSSSLIIGQFNILLKVLLHTIRTAELKFVISFTRSFVVCKTETGRPIVHTSKIYTDNIIMQLNCDMQNVKY